MHGTVRFGAAAGSRSCRSRTRGGELGLNVSALTECPCGGGGHRAGTWLHPNLGAGPAGFPVTSLFPAIRFPGHPGTRFCSVSRWRKAGKIMGQCPLDWKHGERGFRGLAPMSLEAVGGAGGGKDRRTGEGPSPPRPGVRAAPSPRPSPAGREDPAVGGREDYAMTHRAS